MSNSRKRHLKKEQQQFEPLRKRVRQEMGRKVMFEDRPEGQAKMSEVLANFVEPYADAVPTQEAYRQLLTLAVLAWNASFLPEDKQQKVLDEILAGMPQANRQTREDLTECFQTLIIRKKLLFADYKRRIVDFELVDQEEGYFLSVISTLEEADGAHH